MLFSVLVMFATITGNASSEPFAAGFIGSGILAVPMLAASRSAGSAGLLDEPWGLDRSPRKAPVFYGLLVLSAAVDGIAAGPLLVVAMPIARDGQLAASLGRAATAIMLVAGVVVLWPAFTGG
jgi:hypothetical protein